MALDRKFAGLYVNVFASRLGVSPDTATELTRQLYRDDLQADHEIASLKKTADEAKQQAQKTDASTPEDTLDDDGEDVLSDDTLTETPFRAHINAKIAILNGLHHAERTIESGHIANLISEADKQPAESKKPSDTVISDTDAMLVHRLTGIKPADLKSKIALLGKTKIMINGRNITLSQSLSEKLAQIKDETTELKQKATFTHGIMDIDAGDMHLDVIEYPSTFRITGKPKTFKPEHNEAYQLSFKSPGQPVVKALILQSDKKGQTAVVKVQSETSFEENQTTLQRGSYAIEKNAQTLKIEDEKGSRLSRFGKAAALSVITGAGVGIATFMATGDSTASLGWGIASSLFLMTGEPFNQLTKSLASEEKTNLFKIGSPLLKAGITFAAMSNLTGFGETAAVYTSAAVGISAYIHHALTKSSAVKMAIGLITAGLYVHNVVGWHNASRNVLDGIAQLPSLATESISTGARTLQEGLDPSVTDLPAACDDVVPVTRFMQKPDGTMMTAEERRVISERNRSIIAEYDCPIGTARPRP